MDEVTSITPGYRALPTKRWDKTLSTQFTTRNIHFYEEYISSPKEPNFS
jgi:hypothetical protein